jgi:threonine dehydratase
MATTLAAPTFEDVLKARRQIAPYLKPTPLLRHLALDRLTGTETWVKHENHNPTGAFKVRGGVNLVGRLSQNEKKRGVISASTGNHGQSVAYAARLFETTAVICAPEVANPVKVQAMRDLGAEVVLQGRNFDESKENAERLAEQHGHRYINSGDEPLLIAGVGTYTLEIFEAEPEIEVVLVPLGGGSGASGASLVKHAIKPGAQVIAVSSERAPAGYNSWRDRRLQRAPVETIAEGLSAGVPFELPQRILWDLLDDFVLVSDEDLMQATAAMITGTRNLVEPAGAAALAGAIKLKDRLAGKKIALVCSGGNISPAQLKEVAGRLS